VAIQTGSICISDNVTLYHFNSDANLRFWTRASSQKVSTSDRNIERQPEIATWPPKPEIVRPLELQQTVSKFQRQILDFRPGDWRARIKCSQLTATMTDNRKWQCGRQNRKYLYLWNYNRQDDNSNGKSESFDHAQLEETEPDDCDND